MEASGASLSFVPPSNSQVLSLSESVLEDSQRSVESLQKGEDDEHRKYEVKKDVLHQTNLTRWHRTTHGKKSTSAKDSQDIFLSRNDTAVPLIHELVERCSELERRLETSERQRKAQEKTLKEQILALKEELKYTIDTLCQKQKRYDVPQEGKKALERRMDALSEENGKSTKRTKGDQLVRMAGENHHTKESATKKLKIGRQMPLCKGVHAQYPSKSIEKNDHIIIEDDSPSPSKGKEGQKSSAEDLEDSPIEIKITSASVEASGTPLAKYSPGWIPRQKSPDCPIRKEMYRKCKRDNEEVDDFLLSQKLKNLQRDGTKENLRPEGEQREGRTPDELEKMSNRQRNDNYRGNSVRKLDSGSLLKAARPLRYNSDDAHPSTPKDFWNLSVTP